LVALQTPEHLTEGLRNTYYDNVAVRHEPKILSIVSSSCFDNNITEGVTDAEGTQIVSLIQSLLIVLFTFIFSAHIVQ
jgi:hypothetical protein